MPDRLGFALIRTALFGVGVNFPAQPTSVCPALPCHASQRAAGKPFIFSSVGHERESDCLIRERMAVGFSNGFFFFMDVFLSLSLAGLEMEYTRLNPQES